MAMKKKHEKIPILNLNKMKFDNEERECSF